MAKKSPDLSANTVVTEISPDCSPNQNEKNALSDSCNGCHCKKTPDLLSRSFNIAAKRMSPAASSGPFCRICHEGDYHEDLISLCKCAGSVGLVHLSCMERWLSTRRGVSDRCEICNFHFETIRSPKSILEWYNSDQGNAGNKHGILGDMACFSLITPLTSVSAFLCFKGARQQVMWNNGLEAGCLMALGTFLLTIFIVWNVLTFRYHFQNYLGWRSINQNVRLARFRRKSTNTDLGNRAIINETQNNSNGLSTPEANNLQATATPLTPRQAHQSSNLSVTGT